MSTLRLGIDTATRFLCIGLWDEAYGCLARYSEEVGRDHASRIVPELRRLLERNGAEKRRPDAIGVGIGPGSYAGMRVGIATAKGLARAWGVPLGGVSTLASIAAGGLRAGQRGVALLDARRGNVYAASFAAEEAPDARQGSRLVMLHGPVKIARETLSERFGPDAEVVIEGVAPDPCYTAALSASEDPATALYL